MSSPSSSTQQTNFLLTLSTLEYENSHIIDPTESYQNLSAPEIFKEIQELLTNSIPYAANKEITSQCEYVFNRDFKGDVLVPKKN